MIRASSLKSDTERKTAYITYDLNNNPDSIFFTTGSVTTYVYSASGQKLRVVHYTAKPNMEKAWGVKPKFSMTHFQDSVITDYLLGGSLVMKNGKIDKVLFDGGYAQASAVSNTTKDKFAFYYYNQDHLGNNREVVDAKGNVTQVTNYYPFGAPYADATAIKGAAVQPYKYNGKELDLMHGLNTYDYGARQHDPILARWDRMDPLCEKFYNVSPYNYCHNNPVMLVDPDGKDDYKIDGYGHLSFWRRSNAKSTDRIYASNGQKMAVSKKIRESLMTERSDYKEGNYAVGSKNMDKLFKFVADNTWVEWRLVGHNTDEGKKFVLMTTHEDKVVTASNELAGMKEENMELTVHSHPSRFQSSSKPSGFNPNSSIDWHVGDQKIAEKTSDRITKRGGKVPAFYMYHPASNKLVRYDKDRIIKTTIIKDGKLKF